MSTSKSMPGDYYGSAPMSQNGASADPKDISSTKAIVDAMYESISGPAGQPREWNRFKLLCLDTAQSIRTGKLADGSVACKVMTSDEYIQQMDPWFLENGFYETEVHRVEERFGNIVHVFSTYESRHSPSDPTPFMRGINSIQLLYDGVRWWVVNVLWQHETPEFPLPQRYL